MKLLCLLTTAMAALCLAGLLICYVCFRLTFYVRNKDKKSAEEYPIPEGEIYEPWRDKMVAWMKETRALPHQDVSVTSFDGLTLRGKYYEHTPDAPIELMFHGYRGYAERDLCGGVQRCFALGHNALIVDQRASGNSEGNVISFGINESTDCHSWLQFMISHFGPDVKIILTGISMGASTVLCAAGSDLPKNVIGVLADCGFTSPSAIIKKVIRDIKLPEKPAYLFVKLGAKLFGGFDLDEITPLKALPQCTVPVIFFHGEDDAYVPCEMSRLNYDVCTCRKKLVTIPKAGHGLSYIIAPEYYLQQMRDFFYGNK